MKAINNRIPIKTSEKTGMNLDAPEEWAVLSQEEFEDTKEVIRIHISKKNRQHNGQNKKYKRTNTRRVTFAISTNTYCVDMHNFCFIDMTCDWSSWHLFTFKSSNQSLWKWGWFTGFNYKFNFFFIFFNKYWNELITVHNITTMYRTYMMSCMQKQS